MKEIKFGMRVRWYARSALERQVLESGLIQEEWKHHLLMNGKSEYIRCSLPRLTTTIGNKEYDKERQRDQEEERMMDMMVRGEIGRRRKEKCQMRKDEIHPPELTEVENVKHKRRKVNNDGDYKKVLAMKKPEREEETAVNEGAPKKRRIEEQPKRKFLGQVLRGYVLEDPIDWEEERRKRQEAMDKEEQERQARIKKAKRLEESWKLSNICKEYIKGNSQTWRDRDEERESERAVMMRKERTQLAQYKKDRFARNHLRKEKSRKITEMLGELPMGEQERWKKEQRQADGRALKEMKDNMWKKWRGEPKGKDKKIQIPNDDDKLDEKLTELKNRIEQYKLERRKTEERKIKRKKLEDHWQMMRWLVKFIDQNRYTWERRRQIEEDERDMNAVYEDWLAKDKKSQIDEMKAKKQQEMDSEKRKKQRQEKAKIRKIMWKEWRKIDEGSGTRNLPREGVREHPGQDNTLHNTGRTPEKLGGEDPGWGGAYQKLLMDSTAPCNTGPHAHLEDLELEELGQGDEAPQEMTEKVETEMDIVREEERLVEEERIKMEIMLGMTQEEGIKCLLCMMPRCICHITLALTKIDTKLVQLRSEKCETEVRKEAEAPANEGEVEGGLGGLLEGGGLTQTREGSSPPQEPAGVLETKPEGEQKPPEAHTPELTRKMRQMMKKSDEQEAAKKARKAASQKRREEAKRKEERQEAAKNRSVKQMMEKWKEIGKPPNSGNIPNELDSARNIVVRRTSTPEGRKQVKLEDGVVKAKPNPEGKEASPTSGKIPNELDSARNSVVRRTSTPEGRKQVTLEDGVIKVKSNPEGKEASPTSQTSAEIGNLKGVTKFRKKETAEGEHQDWRKHVRKEEEHVRKEPSDVRKQEASGINSPIEKGKFKPKTNIVRKKAGEGSEEAEKLIARNKEQKHEKEEPYQGSSGKVVGSGMKVKRSRISDLISNFNGMVSQNEARQEQDTRNRNKVEKAMMVEDVRSLTMKRKASELEDDKEPTERTPIKRTKSLVAAARKPSSSGKNTLLKYFKMNNNRNSFLASNGSTGENQVPVQTAGSCGGQADLSLGVGEHVQPEAIIATPDALASSDVKQLPG